jgi:RNase adaptor protein for sRNA GlmZ degradation
MRTDAISTHDHVDGQQLRIVSFGFGHGPAPTADIVLDLRERFRDPHVSPQMRKLTGHDPKVIANVLSTRSVDDYIDRIFNAIATLVDLGLGTVVLAAGCTGGRHRSVVFAEQVFLRAFAIGWTAEVLHRDIDKEVLTDRRAVPSRPSGIDHERC